MRFDAAQNPIKSVTVFKSDQAEVVREFHVNLEPGQNTIEIIGLPSIIDQNSIRVTNISNARLVDIVCKLLDGDSTEYKDPIAEKIRQLRNDKKMHESEKAVRETQAHLLVSYAKTLTGEHVKPDEMGKFLASFAEQGRKSVSEIAKLDANIYTLQQKIAAYTEQAQTRKGSTRASLALIIHSETATPVDMNVNYIVTQASWHAEYELYATTENGQPSTTVTLQYWARITQSTGEDWTDTALTLSTIRSSLSGHTIPEPKPAIIRGRWFTPLFGPSNANKPTTNLFSGGAQQPVGGGGLFGAPTTTGAFGAFGAQPAPQVSSTNGAGLFGAASNPTQQQQQSDLSSITPPAQNPTSAADAMISGSEPEPKTVVTATPMAVSFSVTGKSTVPSDGSDHRATLGSLPFECRISHVVVPAVDTRVFLQCKVKNTSELKLLPGPCNVIYDGNFVSKTSITDVSVGDEFDCSLGQDTTVQVTYSREQIYLPGTVTPFQERRSTTSYTTTASVHNKGTSSIPNLVVRDVLPTSEIPRLSIILRTPAGLIGKTDGQEVRIKDNVSVLWEEKVEGKGGQKEGYYRWEGMVGPGEKETFVTKWDVEAPTDVQWASPFVQTK